MTDTLGLYIHIPFCEGGKCPYCDFYSVGYDDILSDEYTKALKKYIAYWSKRADGRIVDTVYFGGGTPSVLKERLALILSEIKGSFDVSSDAEITFEANPASDFFPCLNALARAGFNRISIGLQSSNEAELKILGRKHSPGDAEKAVIASREAGIDNISLDIMLCTPGQTIKTAAETAGFIAGLKPKHVSAYLLKIEKGTKFSRIKESLNLPDDDAQGEFYLEMCGRLENLGFSQYEISNFALPGFESRHNLKYWNCREYIGIGPAAHSFFEGRRVYYERDLGGFIKGCIPVDDGAGGNFEEYCMLKLRLSSGLSESDMKRKFGRGFEAFRKAPVRRMLQEGFIQITGDTLHLTAKGFLVSNCIISELIF